VKREELVGCLLALGAATAYGVNAVVIRQGIELFGVALPGLAVSMLVGLLCMAPISLRALPPTRPAPKAVGFIVLSGLAASVGIGSYTLALTQLPVSVVSPISSVYPLVTMLLARLFLQQSERVTWRMALGAALVVAGVILVALGRPQ
jgi:drug/metabolite transporter (DMT)-like permease